MILSLLSKEDFLRQEIAKMDVEELRAIVAERQDAHLSYDRGKKPEKKCQP